MPRRIGLPLPEWPEPDRALWDQFAPGTSYFDNLSPAASWRPKTRYQAGAAYGRWLAFLRSRYPNALAQPIAQRPTLERLNAYVGALASRLTAMSIAVEFHHMLLALRALAPEADWSSLGRLRGQWQRRAVPRDKRAMIVHPARLIELGIALMDGAQRQQAALAEARQFRDGLLIALLAARPLRRANLTALALDTHMRYVGDRYVVTFEGHETKCDQPIDFELPPRLSPYLSRYLNHHRLVFPRAATDDALWLSSKGGALGAEAIYSVVCRRTRDAFGFAIHPHLFRDIAATAIAREAPDSLFVARDLLTHVKIETTMDQYAQRATAEAARAHAATLQGLRDALAKQHGRVAPPPARPPR